MERVPATRALRAAGRPTKAEARGLAPAALGASTARVMAFTATTDMATIDLFCVLKLRQWWRGAVGVGG